MLGFILPLPMSEPHAPPSPLSQPPPALFPSNVPLQPPPMSLYKQKSWSPDAYRDEAWLRRKSNSLKHRSKSVTDEDLDELKACIELGFGFDSPEADQRLSDTLPALELYYAVNKNYSDSISKPTTSTTKTTTIEASYSPPASECDTPSPLGSPHTMFCPGDNNPQTMKTRLKQWAQVVACSVRQSSS